eukprot:156117-Hanusia_phi.AAC.1
MPPPGSGPSGPLRAAARAVRPRQAAYILRLQADRAGGRATWKRPHEFHGEVNDRDDMRLRAASRRAVNSGGPGTPGDSVLTDTVGEAVTHAARRRLLPGIIAVTDRTGVVGTSEAFQPLNRGSALHPGCRSGLSAPYGTVRGCGHRIGDKFHRLPRLNQLGKFTGGRAAGGRAASLAGP